MDSETSALRRGVMLLGSALLVLGGWQCMALAVTSARGVAFPTPGDTALSLLKLFGGMELAGRPIYAHVADSLVRWAWGFGVAAVAAVVYGLLAGCRRVVEELTVPIVHMLQLVPGLAWIPVALLVFGIGERATIFMIAVTAFSPIAINVLSGVKRVDGTFVRAGRMLGARGPGLFVRVLIPGSLPSILSGLRIGMGNSWRVLVAAEMVVGTGTGLGYAIIQSRWTLDYPAAFACVAIICLIGLVLDRCVFAVIERATVERWGVSHRK